uniref:Helitron helicase-like domain-containing protein n=1 Tax=Salix viminalis TaxID=40686 RepID=A0A6N2N1A7_SALVM
MMILRSNDVCGLVVGDIGDSHSDIEKLLLKLILKVFEGSLNCIPNLCLSNIRSYFHYGEDGYHTNIPFANQEHLISCKTSKKLEMTSTLAKGGRLYQQFLVDAFMKRLFSEDVNGSSTGKIILPSSLTGSPRYMMNNYQDAMAICHKPDIIARVFQYKLIDMVSFIKSRKALWQNNVCAVEIQKRGLPHTHLLVWLASEYKFRSPDDVDSIISAEIPDKKMILFVMKLFQNLCCMAHAELLT